MQAALRQTVAVYEAFGMRLSSDVPLPELPIAGRHREDPDGADIVIETVDDPIGLWKELEAGGTNFWRTGDRFLFLIPETAVFCIENGFKITVAPLRGADPEKVRVYLLGTCMGALLMIRRLLPLHGSAVEIDGKAYAFVGESGAGKSTLAAAFVGNGYRLISDDVAAVAFSGDGKPVVMPSYPQQKLWQESIDGLGMASGHYRPIYQETEKYAVPVTSRFCAGPVPLAGVFELVKSEREKLGVERLPNLERLRVLLQQTYRHALIPRLGLADWHFRTAASIAAPIGMYRLKRPTEGFAPDRLVSRIIHTVQEGEKRR